MHKVIYLVMICIFTINIGHTGRLPKFEKIQENVEFKDDLNFKFLLKAINRQEVNFSKKNLNEEINFGGRLIKRKHLQTSLLKFKDLIEKAINCQDRYSTEICQKNLSDELNILFEIYRPVPLKWEAGYNTKETQFTAYYSPDFEASLTPTEEFKNPIYGQPNSGNLKKLTSDEINFQGKLKNKGLELLYVKKSLYDIWLLHVEGGGRAKVKQLDGSYKYYYLSYAGSNGQKFQMLYKYMLEQGMLVKGSAKIRHQRAYFLNNPDDQRAILASCPSFIFFKITKTEPLGVENIPLTEQRSLATDYRRIKEYGIINFVMAKKPIAINGNVTQTPFSRFFINQDTGGAIKGNARSDLYFGYGKEAELAANYIYGLGKQYFLILK